jgi:hypothetical protein
MRAKNAAYPQKSFCDHLSKGWLWHSAHWIWIPRKARDVLAATFSGFNSSEV